MSQAQADARETGGSANSRANLSAEPVRADKPLQLTPEQMSCECVFCAQERRRRGIEAEAPVAVGPNRTPDHDAMDRYLYLLLPGSLGYNQDWSILMAGQRFVGGKPIDFKAILQRVYRGKARRALYADLGMTNASLDGGHRVDVLDRSELDEPGSTDAGGWMVVSAYARTKGAGPRTSREIMVALGLLQPEIEVRMVPMLTTKPKDYLGDTKPDYRTTSRFAAWVAQAGFGRRMKSNAGIEFDVLSPDGVAWLNAHWPHPVEKPKAKRGRRSSLRAEVHRLLADGKTQAEIARLLGVSRQIVSHHAKAF